MPLLDSSLSQLLYRCRQVPTVPKLVLSRDDYGTGRSRSLLEGNPVGTFIYDGEAGLVVKAEVVHEVQCALRRQ